MPYDTSYPRTVIGALQTRLAARSGLSGVVILKYAPDSKTTETLLDYIVMAVRIPATQTPGSLGRGIVYDTFSIHGEINTHSKGGGDASADAAFAQAETWLAEIEDEVRTTPSVGLSKVTARLVAYEHVPTGATDKARWHTTRFEIAVQARLTTH